MKAFLLTNFEELTLQELKEFGLTGKKVGEGVVSFSGKAEELVRLCHDGQSIRKVLIDLGKLEKIDALNDYLFEGCRFMVDVEGVKGQDNRIEIGKKVGQQIFDGFKGKLEFDYKNPEVVVLVYFDGKNYFVGVDLAGRELDKRKYRVFLSSSSFRGDLAYYLVRKSGFERGEKLVVGLVKDGTVLIEAGLYDTKAIVNKGEFAFEKMPAFRDVKVSEQKKGETKVYGFDERMMAVKASQKNAKLAGVKVELRKHNLDELDVKFVEGAVDRLIFLLTRKDEDNLNEIYHQASYVLRKKGTLLLVGREGGEISVADRFKLKSEEVVKKGGSGWKVLLMEKK